MTTDGTPIRTSLGPLGWFAATYVVLAVAWWYTPALAAMDSLALDIAGEIAIFAGAVAIGGYLLKVQRPGLTKRDRHIFARWSVAIVWAFLLAMTAVETLLQWGEASDAWIDLVAQVESSSLGLAIVAAVAFVVLLVSNLYYFLARLILHFVAPPNRISAQ